MPETSALEAPDTTSFGVDFAPQKAVAPEPATDPASRARTYFEETFSPEKMASVTAQHASLLQGKMKQSNWTDQQAEGRLEKDRSQMQQALGAERAAADALPPPWNADKERKERISGPIEQFGSLGMVFAMAASAFTKTPMTSALNAGAAAMKSIQEHDEKGYESAYAAWKDNTNLALKRFDMERSMFDDANKLMATDMSLWRAKQASIAAKFNDQTALMFLNNGMDDKLLEKWDGYIKAADGIRKAQEGWEQYDIKRKVWKEDPRAKGTPQERLELAHDLAGGKLSVEEQLLRDFRRDKRAETGQAPTAEEESTFLREHKQFSRTLSPEQEFIQRWWAANPDATTDEFTKAFGEFKQGQKPPPGANAGGNANLTNERQDAQARANKKKELLAEGKSEEEAERGAAQYAAQLKAARSAPSGNKIDQMKSMTARIGYASETIDSAEKLLKKHNALTGLGGKITRPMEVVGNWFKSNETDRAEFRRYISLLQEWGSRILNEASGRPLSAEESRIAAIIPGLSMGDTTANTARGLKELRELMQKMKTDLNERMKVEPRGSTPTAPPGGNWWGDLPDRRAQ